MDFLSQQQTDDLSAMLHKSDPHGLKSLLEVLVAEHLSAHDSPVEKELDSLVKDVVAILIDKYAVFQAADATLVDIRTTYEQQLTKAIQDFAGSDSTIPAANKEPSSESDQETLYESPDTHPDNINTLPTDSNEHSTQASSGHRSRPTALQDDTIANRFGDYELLEEIARGGMGIVYKARQIALNRTVAIKMILSGQFANEDEMERFYAEAEAAASLNHPNIVTIYEIGEVEKQHFFSMEYVPGDSLSDLVREHPLGGLRAARYTSAICDAVHLAHDNGILHRDLKPANVLINNKDVPLVTDFGLAKQVHEKSGMTMEGSVLGTPSYMPPEQARGNLDDVDVRSDIYSIGATLYELITGTPPFSASSVYETIRQVLHQEPADPQDRNPDIPQDLSTICMKCLQKTPDKRYQSAVELREELERFIDGTPILARPIGKTERLTRWCLRNPVIATTSATAIVGILAMLVTMTVAYFVTSDALVDANKSFERSKQTVDDFFVEVTENELLQTPNTRAVREVMLDKALQYYVDLKTQRAGNTSDERALQQDSADLEFKMGRISHAKENLAEAIAHYSRAADSIRLLLNQPGNQQEELTLKLTNYMTPLAAIYADTDTNQTDLKQATTLLKDIRIRREGLYNSNPSSLEHGRLFANACMNLGNLLMAREIYDLAEASYTQAQDIRLELLNQNQSDPKPTTTIQRDLSKGYYQLAVLKLTSSVNPSAAAAEGFFNQALQALEKMQHADRGFEKISEEDHLQSVSLLTQRLHLWIDATKTSRPTELTPEQDIEYGLKHLAFLGNITDRPQVITAQIRFQLARLEVNRLQQNEKAIKQILNEISSLFDAGAYKNSRHSSTVGIRSNRRQASLAALSLHAGSNERFITTLELTMQELADHCSQLKDDTAPAILDDSWLQSWKSMMDECPQVAHRILDELARIEQNEPAQKFRLLKHIDWLQRIQRVDQQMADMLPTLPDEMALNIQQNGLGFILQPVTIDAIELIMRRLRVAFRENLPD
ncbi:MAG: serine/threonine-protein kinase [Planctomycetota bacterium]|nr:serine/threonine-protein kinase [Planctomycetota bacterium]